MDKDNEFFSYAVCFNMKIFETFRDIINKNKNNIFKSDKNKKFKEIIDYLNNNFEKNKSSNDKNIVNYFLYFDIMFKENIMQNNFYKKNSKQLNQNININRNSILPIKSNEKIKEKENNKIDSPELIEIKRILSEILINISDIDINEINQKIKSN